MILQNKLWTEKYRPTKITDYVFVDSNQQTLVESWITEGIIPHLLFSGEPGTGKTTLAKILINELDIDELDVLEINASRENSVDNVRTKIHNFVETMPFGKYKIVLLDEADYLTRDAQASLRNDMETYASTVRFILTCNYEHRVIPALRESRCVKMHISKPDHTEFMARAATVLMAENVQFTIETLEYYVGITYPDLRKCLNQLQANSTSGELLLKSSEDDQHSDLIKRPDDRFKLFNKKFRPWKKTGRKILIAKPDEKPCKFYGIDLSDWIENTITEVKKYTDRPVAVRERAAKRIDRIKTNTLQEALDDDVFALVTFNSVAAVESIFHGIPTFTLAPTNAADPMSLKDLSKIENPFYPTEEERYAWACHLAYGQFHINELKSGNALKMLLSK